MPTRSASISEQRSWATARARRRCQPCSGNTWDKRIGRQPVATKDARNCFSKAHVKWDHIPDLPVQKKHCCRVLDEWASVFIEEGNYQQAEPLLEHAWEYSLGKWTHDYADLENVQYRADRLAFICRKRGKDGMHWFADTVEELERISSDDRALGDD